MPFEMCEEGWTHDMAKRPADKPSKPKKPPAWLDATKARLRTKGASPKPAPLAEPERLDEAFEGLTALFEEALRVLPGDVALAAKLAEEAWNGPSYAAQFPPEQRACLDGLFEIRRARFGGDQRAAFMVRVVERAGGWEIRARMVDLG